MLRNQGALEQVLKGRLTSRCLYTLDAQPYYSAELPKRDRRS